MWIFSKYILHFLIFQSYQSQENLEWGPNEFHDHLIVISFQSIDDVERYYSENYHVLTGHYGVLLFMYTVLMSKVGEISGPISSITVSKIFSFRNWRILMRNYWTHRSH